MKKALPLLVIAGGVAAVMGGGKKSTKKKSKSKSDDKSETPLPDVTAKSAKIGVTRGTSKTMQGLPRRLTPDDRDHASKAANNILAFMKYDGSGLSGKKTVEVASMIGDEMFPLGTWPKTIQESNEICSEVSQDSSFGVTPRDAAWCDLIRIVEEASGYGPVI